MLGTEIEQLFQWTWQKLTISGIFFISSSIDLPFKRTFMYLL